MEIWSHSPQKHIWEKVKYFYTELFKTISALTKPKWTLLRGDFLGMIQPFKTEALQADFSQNQWWERALNRAASQLSSDLAVCEVQNTEHLSQAVFTGSTTAPPASTGNEAPQTRGNKSTGRQNSNKRGKKSVCCIMLDTFLTSIQNAGSCRI